MSSLPFPSREESQCHCWLTIERQIDQLSANLQDDFMRSIQFDTARLRRRRRIDIGTINRLERDLCFRISIECTDIPDQFAPGIGYIAGDANRLVHSTATG